MSRKKMYTPLGIAIRLGVLALLGVSIFFLLEEVSSDAAEQATTEWLIDNINEEIEVSEINLERESLLASQDLAALILAYKMAAEQLAEEHDRSIIESANKNQINQLIEKVRRQAYNEGYEQGKFEQSLQRR